MKSAKGKHALAAACFLGGAVVLVFAPAAAISEEEDRGRRKADPVLHGTPRIKAINWHNSQALPDPAELIETCASSARCFTLVVDSDGAPLAYSAGQEPVSPRPTRRSRQHAAQTAAGAVAASADGSAAVLARRGGIEQGNGAPFANTLRPPAATGPGGGPGLAAGAIEQGMPVACLLSRTGIARLLAGLGSDDPPASLHPPVTLTRPARLFASAAGKKVIRALEMGITLHPTGATRGFMWEIEDELGNRGWVSSTCCSCPAAEICRTQR